jgi:AcrR family transcriptional regulator
VATQEQRRARTRSALLAAAAELFASRGIEGASIDTIAEAADRTSGAVYDHFGGKDGLLFALLDGWVDDVAAVVGAELTTAGTLDERLLILWRNVSDPVVGDGRWIALEHELWSYATRNETAREHLARRYRVLWDGIDAGFSEWMGDGPTDVGPTDAGPADVGPAVIGLLLGLEMMRRVDPGAVTDDLAIAALRGVVTGATRGAST